MRTYIKSIERPDGYNCALESEKYFVIYKMQMCFIYILCRCLKKLKIVAFSIEGTENINIAIAT